MSILLALAFSLAAEILPPWTPGTLDIHQINTGRGDSAYLILPDGTTLLIDAGDGGPAGPPRFTAALPNASRAPGEWIARYIRRVTPGSIEALDHAYLSHFHGDHMGQWRANLPDSKLGTYKLTGITELAEHLPFKRLCDRGWPGYDWPAPMEDDPQIRNYRAFVAWQMQHRGLKVERFAAGRNDQFKLLREPGRYPNFSIRNVAVNGEVWTGVGDNTVLTYPPLASLKPADYPRENPSSAAIKLSYGKFDYFHGGDLSASEIAAEPWRDMETPVAKAIGPVDVIKLNHHGNGDGTTEFFLRHVRPRVFVIPVWSSDHPGQRVLQRLYSEQIYPGPRDGFAIGMLQANKDVIGPLLGRLKSDQGHVLVRVEPGGARYSVLILEDSDESNTVKAKFGPYESR